ncbi:hypothetical protein MFIFM68171_07683 [Madurella fahalii]|uniref:Uncharacterized protein n=1 Tax=Madurella fahalii TaxID=1157608 RepID=A0ABQ0GI84_9PEZI
MNSSARYASIGFVVDVSTIDPQQKCGGKTLIPGAREAISILLKQRIPFVIVTSYTNTTEKEAARDLSAQLALKIKPRNILLPQSPFRDCVREYKNKSVLVLGGDGEKARRMLQEYGFNDVWTSRDVVKLQYDAASRQKLPAGEEITISAIFVLWTPENWDLDIRICINLLLSHSSRKGAQGADRKENNTAAQKEHLEIQPQLFVCMTDTSLVGDRPFLRRDRTWIDTLVDEWTAKTGKALEYYHCGTGRDRVTLAFADKLLNGYNKRMHPTCHPFPRTVYMIGADISFGGNTDRYAAVLSPGVRRRSIRVDVHGRGLTVHDFDAALKPWHVTSNVKEALEYALAEEYWECIEARLTPLFSRPDWARSTAIY